MRWGLCQGLSYWRCRRRQQPRWSRGCMRESSFGNALGQQYPTVEAAPSGPPGTWSKSARVSRVVCRIAPSGRPHLGQEIDTDRRLIHVVERIVHESCDQGGLAHCRISSSVKLPEAGRTRVGRRRTTLLSEKHQPGRVVSPSIYKRRRLAEKETPT